MATTDDDQGGKCATCPRCRLREWVAAAMTDEDLRQTILDALLDTVERVRAVAFADGDDQREAAEEAAEHVVELLDEAIGTTNTDGMVPAETP